MYRLSTRLRLTRTFVQTIIRMNWHGATAGSPPSARADTPDTIDCARSATDGVRSVEPLDADLKSVCAGIGYAIGTLLRLPRKLGAAPIVFDERSLRSGLCRTGAPVVSFVWTDRRLGRFTNPDVYARLHAVAMEQLLLLMAERTGTSVVELVAAYVLFERAIRLNLELLKPWTVRLLFLAAFSLATKAAHDLQVEASDVLAPIDDIFTGLDAAELAHIEWELLERIHYRVPIDGNTYVVYLTELLDAGGGGRPEHSAARALLQIQC